MQVLQKAQRPVASVQVESSRKLECSVEKVLGGTLCHVAT